MRNDIQLNEDICKMTGGDASGREGESENMGYESLIYAHFPNAAVCAFDTATHHCSAK